MTDRVSSFQFSTYFSGKQNICTKIICSHIDNPPFLLSTVLLLFCSMASDWLFWAVDPDEEEDDDDDGILSRLLNDVRLN